MTKIYWITDDRFKWISLLLFLMFIGLMLLFYLKADEVTKNPCQICAKKMGENISCTMWSAGETRIFSPDYGITDKSSYG